VKTTLFSAVLITTLAVFLTGCSRSPVAPSADPSAQPGAGSMRGTQIDDPPAPVQGSPGASQSVTLNVGDSGTITAGRFSVFLHKNTLNHPITVTMWVESPNATAVEFTVSPPDANNFQVPAMVTGDFSDMPTLDLSTQTMYYWEAAWDVPEGVMFDQTAHTITAPLKLLSNCKVAAQPGGKNHLSE
jgi:hypothetical protein